MGCLVSGEATGTAGCVEKNTEGGWGTFFCNIAQAPMAGPSGSGDGKRRFPSGCFLPKTVRQAGRILLDKGGFLAVSVCDLRSESDRCPIYESDVISVTRDEFFRFFPLVSERRSPATSCDAGRIHRKKDILSVIIIDFSTAFGYSTSAVSIRQFRSFERQIGLSKKNSKKKGGNREDGRSEG